MPPENSGGATLDTTPRATRYTTGCDSKRYELPTGLPLGSLRDANWSVAQDTTGYQPGCCPQRVHSWSVIACILCILFYRSIDAMLTMVKKRYRLGGEEAVHSGQYECDGCGQVYRHRTSLRRHQRQAHTGRRTCPECSEVLQGEESLARHITREHGSRQLDDVADKRQQAPVPPPVTEDATVDRVVPDN